MLHLVLFLQQLIDLLLFVVFPRNRFLRVVQYTVTDRETMVSVRAVRTDRELQIRSVKKSSLSVNCISLVGLRIFHSRCEREISFLTDHSVRTDRELQFLLGPSQPLFLQVFTDLRNFPIFCRFYNIRSFRIAR